MSLSARIDFHPELEHDQYIDDVNLVKRGIAADLLTTTLYDFARVLYGRKENEVQQDAEDANQFLLSDLCRTCCNLVDIDYDDYFTVCIDLDIKKGRKYGQSLYSKLQALGFTNVKKSYGRRHK